MIIFLELFLMLLIVPFYVLMIILFISGLFEFNVLIVLTLFAEIDDLLPLIGKSLKLYN